MKKLVFAFGASAMFLAGCQSGGIPQPFDSNPVVIYTNQGPVTCELYDLDKVWWDQSISRPEQMSVPVADELCRQEGLRRLNRQ